MQVQNSTDRVEGASELIDLSRQLRRDFLGPTLDDDSLTVDFRRRLFRFTAATNLVSHINEGIVVFKATRTLHLVLERGLKERHHDS